MSIKNHVAEVPKWSLLKQQMSSGDENLFNLLCLEIDDRSDREFMVWLYQEYERIMFATARRYTQDNYVCEVIVQDSLVKLLTKVGQLRKYKRSILTGYIVSTVKHTSIDHLRTAGRENTLQVTWDDDSLGQLPSNNPSAETILILAEQKKLLIKIWSKIPDADRQLLERKYIQGCSDEQLSETFHCKPSSIRMKLTRARRNALALITEYIDRIENKESIQ